MIGRNGDSFTAERETDGEKGEREIAHSSCASPPMQARVRNLIVIYE